MAYTKTEWVSGETPLSATNMNNIENGIKNLESNVNSLLTVTSVTLSNQNIPVGQSKSFSTTISKTGYTAIGVVGLFCGPNGVFPYKWGLDSPTQVTVFLKNAIGSALDAQPVVDILWMKNAS